MKKFFLVLLCCLLLIYCLLIVGCAAKVQPVQTTESAETEETVDAKQDLIGVWRNVGQYTEGRDFVETLTLSEEGKVTVHLEYQGADYATLTGTWTVSDGVLKVDFTDPNTKDRVYTYTLTENALILTGDGKDVEYQRSR